MNGSLDPIKENIYEQELESLKNAFFSNIYHEFITPLNTILSVIQLLDKKYNIFEGQSSNFDMSRNINIIHKNTLRMLRLCNNIIDSMKIESDNIELNIRNYDVVRLVESICEDINNYNMLNSTKIIFDTNIEEHTLKIDPNKIERVVLNLISNAIKFNKDNEDINVDINITKDYSYIHIKDKGIGISEEKLPYIFDTFSDIENRLTKISEGIGIGLSLSNNLVKLHNGSIQVKSEINNGSEFIVKIPNNNSNICLNTLTYEIDKHRLERIKIESSDIY